MPLLSPENMLFSHNLSCPVLDIPTNFHQDIDNHHKGWLFLSYNKHLTGDLQNRGKSQKRFKLSNSEEFMDTLWREDRPLTTLQLAARKPAGTPIISTNCSVSLSKGMVQVSGLLQNGRYQSRQFVPPATPGRISGEHAQDGDNHLEPGTICPNRRGAISKRGQSTNPSRKKS